ncbi:MAG TPA: glycosyltransferase family 39 protein, partial [Gemmatimonadaceae bacterium]|nr:glycosyltransferase family 39 protein [Gemmatimonadaceae bacterium]
MRKLTISVDNRRFAVIALLIVGAFLRLHQLDRYPLGVHQDEVSNIYDGWSIAETGADRFGDPYPTVVRAFGERDYRPALYAWLAAIPVRFTGFSITSGRLPAALLGVASLVLVYVFARNMAGETYGLLALLLATLSPLHVQLSRVAHEGGMLPPFFVILVLWLWQKNAREDFPLRWLIFLGLAIGVSTNSYQSTRLIAPLLLIAVAVDIVRHASSRLRRLTLLCAGAIIGALPQLLFLANETDRFMARARVLSVSTGGPVSYLSSVLYNFWLNLEPYYLFMPRVLRGLTVARLLPIEAPFFYGGLIGLAFLAVRQVSRDRIYVYLALAIAILPA